MERFRVTHHGRVQVPKLTGGQRIPGSHQQYDPEDPMQIPTREVKTPYLKSQLTEAIRLTEPVQLLRLVQKEDRYKNQPQ